LEKFGSGAQFEIVMILFLFLGIITASGALVLEIFFLESGSFFSSPIVHDLSLMFFIAPLTEEALKISVLAKKLLLEKMPKNIALRALLFGAGFFLIELALNLWQNNNALWPLFGILLVHTATSVLAGLFLSKKTGLSYFFLLKLIALNFFLHVFYNLAAMYCF